MSTHTSHVGFKAYFSGFIFFFCLTLISYFVVVDHLLKGVFAMIVIVACAIVQATVQLGVFLDLITEPKPRSNLHVFLLMVTILLIVIAGSLWIMYSLNERVMPMMPMTEGPTSGENIRGTFSSGVDAWPTAGEGI